jgi:hypothetical protein
VGAWEGDYEGLGCLKFDHVGELWIRNESCCWVVVVVVLGLLMSMGLCYVVLLCELEMLDLISFLFYPLPCLFASVKTPASYLFVCHVVCRTARGACGLQKRLPTVAMSRLGKLILRHVYMCLYS